MTTIVELADGHYIVPETGVQYDRYDADGNSWCTTSAGGSHSTTIKESEGGAALGDYLKSIAEKPEMGVSDCHDHDCDAESPRAFTVERGVALARAAGWVSVQEDEWGLVYWYCPAHAPRQGDINP